MQESVKVAKLKQHIIKRTESHMDNCENKVAYPTLYAALRAKHTLLKRKRDMFNKDTLSAYQCMNCFQYHLGNSLQNNTGCI